MLATKIRHYGNLVLGGLFVVMRYVVGRRKDVCVYRILGNDLPPRHKPGQTRDNLKFILEHEPACLGAAKKWIVNHIADAKEEEAILSVLRDAGAEYIHLPIDYRKLAELVKNFSDDVDVSELDKPEVMAVLAYLTNINQARNLCVHDGIQHGFKWVLPLDGSCIFNRLGWWLFLATIIRTRLRDIMMIPMYRLSVNTQYPGFRRAKRVRSEPQVAFHCLSSSRFDDAAIYGQDDKIALVRHTLRTKPANVLQSAYFAGYVIRLSAGVNTINHEGPDMQNIRENSIGEFVKGVIKKAIKRVE